MKSACLLPILGSSSLCQNDSECPPHAICDSHDPSVPFGTCICRPGYVFVAENETKECHPIAEKLGDSCLYDIQCHERFSTESECWKGRCNCKLGSHHVPMPNKCYTSVRKFREQGIFNVQPLKFCYQQELGTFVG